jgi:hypothetical protein
MERKFFAVSGSYHLLNAFIKLANVSGWLIKLENPLEAGDNGVSLIVDTHLHFNSSRTEAGPNISIAGSNWTYHAGQEFTLPDQWDLAVAKLNRLMKKYEDEVALIPESPEIKTFTDSAFLKEGEFVYVSLLKISKIFNVDIKNIRISL